MGVENEHDWTAFNRARRAEWRKIRTRRRVRRALQLGTLLEFGDGVTAPCCIRYSKECPAVVDLATLTLDRWPEVGEWGGQYEPGNVWPACRHCNSSAPHDWPRMVPLWAVLEYALRTYRDQVQGQFPIPCTAYEARS